MLPARNARLCVDDIEWNRSCFADPFALFLFPGKTQSRQLFCPMICNASEKIFIVSDYTKTRRFTQSSLMEMEATDLHQILLSDDLCVQSEESVFKCVANWLDNR